MTRYSNAVKTVALSRLTVLTLLLVLFAASPFTPASAAEQGTHPLYKPSSRSPQPIDILTNGYGASRSAPEALEIGDRVPDFSLPRAGGGDIVLADQLAQGTVVLIFYRGHW